MSGVITQDATKIHSMEMQERKGLEEHIIIKYYC